MSEQRRELSQGSTSLGDEADLASLDRDDASEASEATDRSMRFSGVVQSARREPILPHVT